MGTPSFSFVPTLFPFRLFPIVEKRRRIFREIVFATGNLGKGEEEDGNRRAFDLCEISFLEIENQDRSRVELKSGKIFSLNHFFECLDN